MAPRSSQAAVEDGVLKRVSPSQIKEYEQCPRKWYFAKVQGLPVVSRNQKSLDFGSALHKEIENFILEAQPLTSALAKLGLEYIPTTSGLLVETRVEDPWVAAAGIHVDGYIDLVVPGLVPEIIDWKTTSDIDKWGKTSQELRSDVQMLTYAKWAHAKYDADEVRLSHVQFQTKGRPWVSKKSTIVTLDETNRAWLSVNHQVANMSSDAGKKTPAEVHGNTDSCDNYGGCPFQHVCPSHTRGKDMASLLEKLRGKTGTPSPTTPGPVVVSSPVLDKAEAKIVVKDGVYMTQQEAKMANGSTILVAPKTEDVLRGPPEDFTPPDMPGEEMAVMPSNKPLPDAVQKEESKPKGRPKGSKNKPKDEDKALSDADLKAVTAAVETEFDNTPRPSKNDLDSGVALRTEADVRAAELKNLSKSPAAIIRYESEAELEKLSNPLRLFINCYPSSPSQDLTQYVNELNIEASNQEKIPDVRLSESKLLGFGKWKGVLAQLAKSRPPTGDCFIATSDLNDPVIEALIPLAALVVRAR